MSSAAKIRTELVEWPAEAAIFAGAEPFIKYGEGFRAHAYMCPANKPTIGWGCTRYPDGRAVKLSDPACSQAEAQIWMECAMHRVLERLKTHAGITRAPTAHQAIALLSLAYNVGVGAHDGVKGDLADSTLLDKFNSGDIESAADHFLEWDKAHIEGVLMAVPGLLVRRQAERKLFLTP